MFLTLGIKLYTSRVILVALGVEDFGIYNAVAGVITLFTFVNSSMINSTQRFLTFALGKNDKKQVHEVFCTSINVHAIISLLIVLLGETVGLYILNCHMVIPEHRIYAANWIYQFTVISAVIGIMSVPYNALIIAHEKMEAFAYITIVEVVLQLFVALLTGMYDTGDRLILYAFLIASCSVFIRCIYGLYCSKKFAESKYHFFIDKKLLTQMTSFAGWTVIGTFSYMGYTQGLNILLNMFFGPIVNAANGIALQVQSSALGFSSNIQKAINPQITKNYAANNQDYMMKLIYASTKFSFLLLWLIVLPLIFDADILLRIWLGNVPDYTREFIILTLFTSIICCGANPIITAIQATGNIRKYQIIEGIILISIIPITYLLLQYKRSPFIVFLVPLTIHTVAQVARCILLKQQIHYSMEDYFKRNIIPMILQIAVSFTIAYMLIGMVTVDGLWHLCMVVLITVIVNLVLAIFILLNKSERNMLKKYYKSGKNKTKKLVVKIGVAKKIGGGKISIVIPLYNKASHIKRTIESVLSQTFTDFELIVVDDGSTDEGARIVKSIDDQRIVYLYKDNGGVSSARNYGVMNAKHDLILLLDADDILYKDCLKHLIKPIIEDETIDICCGKYHKLKNGEKSINSKFVYEGYIPDNFRWLIFNRFGLRAGCCIIKRDILLKYSFDERLSRFEDMKCILEWCKDSSIYRINEAVMAYNNDSAALSRTSSDTTKDFTFHLDFKNKSFWARCMLGRLLYLGWIGYPDKRTELLRLYRANCIYGIFAKIGIQINKLKN